MAKSAKPYPGMGAFVLILNYVDADGDHWIPHCGAASEAKLRAERSRLPQWPDSRVRIVPNDLSTIDRRADEIVKAGGSRATMRDALYASFLSTSRAVLRERLAAALITAGVA